MTNEKRFFSLARGSILFLVIIFTFFIVITPSIYAFTQEAKEEQVSSRHYMELMNSIFNFVEKNFVDEVDKEKLYAGAIKGMMDSLEDDYSTYLDKASMRSLSDTTVGSFGGVGLSITKPVLSTSEKPAYVEVVSPIEDTPGWKAGIQSGDLIISIDGTATPEITMEEVLNKLRGEIGKDVTLTIRRGKTFEFPVTLTRALIEVPTVKFGIIHEAKEKIGYLRIIEFTPQTPERVEQALQSFKKEQVASLIIDLRNNPGGLISSVSDVADKFIDEGVIVSTRGRNGREDQVYRAKSKKTTVVRDLPIVVLINKGSASASEILSGALKDYHLAYLVGERTFGKGSVQQVIGLPYSDGVKLTMARYYTPSDANIDKIGIPPDLEIKMPELSEKQEEAYFKLLEDDVVVKKVEKNPHMTEKDISVYATELQKDYDVPYIYLRRLIKLEVYRTKESPLYDLDFDIQLKKAIEILETQDFATLVKSTKTVSELQKEAQDELETTKD